LKEIIELCEYETIKCNFTYFLSNLKNVSCQEIIDFFKQNMCNKKTIVLPQEINKPPQDTYKVLSVPFVKTKPRKPYSLVIDLDETLIHLQTDSNNAYIGTVTFRPGLFEFLDEMVKHYELILFTCGTRPYATSIIDSIEKEKRYFDHRLFRDHSTIIGNEYIKDLSLIGRELSKTIIIDNTPENFRLQKENGISIKTFTNEIIGDRCLLELIAPLKKTIENKPSDIRKELLKYKSDIERLLE